MTGNWIWVARYVLVMLVALILGAVFGELSMFKQATLGTPKLTAGMLVEFIGYGGPLVLLWLLGQRAATQLRDAGGNSAFLAHMIPPLATLLVACLAYSVLLLVLRPFLDATPRNLYNWTFVVVVTAAALWLIVSVFQHAEPLVEFLRRPRSHSQPISGTHPISAPSKCRSCGAATSTGANFCSVCGAAIVAR